MISVDAPNRRPGTTKTRREVRDEFRLRILARSTRLRATTRMLIIVIVVGARYLSRDDTRVVSVNLSAVNVVIFITGSSSIFPRYYFYSNIK